MQKANKEDQTMYRGVNAHSCIMGNQSKMVGN